MTHNSGLPTSPSFRAWIAAIRPKTLPAGILPVMVGSAAAYHDNGFAVIPALIALVCAILIQILTNFINEIYDFRKGADTAERLGPLRTVANGIISESMMLKASILVATVTFALGLWLVWIAGWAILLIGLLSLLMAWAYTGGPYPLAYKGLGEIFVILFFGIAAVMGTYYAQTGYWSYDTLFLALPLGLLSSNLLSINNIRDRETDSKAQKRTIATRIGRKNAELVLDMQTLLSYVFPIILSFRGYSYPILLPLLTLPIAVIMLKSVKSRDGRELNISLQDSAKLLVIFGLVLTIGVLLS
ncbi:MAG: 1,4-dihydroxy-2-naphthoate polyprenyltransferase [Candidatus Kapaibacterium sp.]|jgi:1,4-dihydroxy-2-naphthoate octaprenyltransferase